MKRVKEQAREPSLALWWVEQSKEEPTKHPSSKQRRPLPNNNSSKRLRQTPHTSKVSTHLSDHSPHVWTLADTQLNNNLVYDPQCLPEKGNTSDHKQAQDRSTA